MIQYITNGIDLEESIILAGYKDIIVFNESNRSELSQSRDDKE